MREHNSVQGTLRFTLFNIPVEIQPFSWLILGLLGLSMGGDDAKAIQVMIFFIVIGMLTLLAHEFGHALVGRYFTRCTPSITIGGMGGITHHPVGMPDSKSHFLMILAGPLASLALGLVLAIILGVMVGNVWAGITFYLLEPISFITDIHAPFSHILDIYNAVASGELSTVVLRFFSVSLMICFWWTVFNLLPILPMDGGQLLLTASRNRRMTSGIGMVLSGLLAIYFVSGGGIFMTLMMGYFAWINWKIFNHYRR